MFRFGDAPAMNPPRPLPAVRVLPDRGESLDRAEPVLLEHFWPSSATPARTTVRIGWTPDCLFVHAGLDDAEITTRATADSQHLWMLGDVFEIFLEAEHAGFYTEMHVAPGNHRLHLRLAYDDFASMKNKTLTVENVMIRPPQFESRCLVGTDGWTVDARIPAELVDPRGVITPESQWRASFCRYDASSDGRPPVLSSTSAHEQVNFHLRQDWRPICF